MVLYLIGIGLCDEQDITLRSLKQGYDIKRRLWD